MGAIFTAGPAEGPDEPLCLVIGPDGKAVQMPCDGFARAAVAADAEFLNLEDPFQVLQLRPVMKAEVPTFYKLKPGEQMLCVMFAGKAVRRIGLGADVRGQAAIRQGLAILRRIDPKFYAILRDCLAFTRRAERFTRKPASAPGTSRRQRRRSGRR